MMTDPTLDALWPRLTTAWPVVCDLGRSVDVDSGRCARGCVSYSFTAW